MLDASAKVLYDGDDDGISQRRGAISSYGSCDFCDLP